MGKNGIANELNKSTERANALLDEIKEFVNVQADNPNWGHVGDIRYVNGQLRNVLGFLAGEPARQGCDDQTH